MLQECLSDIVVIVMLFLVQETRAGKKKVGSRKSEVGEFDEGGAIETFVTLTREV